MLKSKHSTCMNSLVCLTTLTYTKLRSCTHDMNRMLGLMDCSQTKWKNCPKAWAGSYQSKETLPQLFSRELRTIIFFGIHCTVMQEHSTIKHYFTCPLFRSAFWMDLLGRESADLGWFHSKLQTKSTKSLILWMASI